MAVAPLPPSTFFDKRRQSMNAFVETLNFFIGNVIEYTFLVAVYGFVLYNMGKVILSLIRYALYYIRRDIKKYKSNKDKR
jgi:hypothetical protein